MDDTPMVGRMGMTQQGKDRALELVVEASTTLGDVITRPSAGDQGLGLIALDAYVHDAMWALIAAGAVVEEPAPKADGLSPAQASDRALELMREAVTLFPSGAELTTDEFQAAASVLLGAQAMAKRS